LRDPPRLATDAPLEDESMPRSNLSQHRKLRKLASTNVFSLDVARDYRALDRHRQSFLAAGGIVDEYASLFEDPAGMRRPWIEWLRADPI
jgi:hypothetical protein